jgi:hypothetical protein
MVRMDLGVRIGLGMQETTDGGVVYQSIFQKNS